MGLRSAFRKHSYGKKAFKLAEEGNFRDAMDLIDKGGDVNYQADYEYKMFRNFHMLTKANCNMGFIALEKNNMQALEGLLQHGLEPNGIVNKDPDCPLLRSAISRRNQQAVNLLVKFGARMDATLGDLKTLREYATENGIKLPVAQPSKKFTTRPQALKLKG